jgi:hypothetical protein
VAFPIGTNIPVRVEDSLRLAGEPKTLGALLAARAAARLAQSGFDNLIYDDFIDSPQIDPAEDEPIRYGDRGMVALNYIGYVHTTTTALGTTPELARLDFDTWWIDYQTDPNTGRLQRMLTDVTNHTFPSGPLGNVYLGGDFGAGPYTVNQGEVTAIPLYAQGSTFSLQMKNYDSAQWLYSGGWALMY